VSVFLEANNGDEDGREWEAILTVDMAKEQIAEAQKLSREMVEANPKLIN
jgi:hypothetical protein